MGASTLIEAYLFLGGKIRKEKARLALEFEVCEIDREIKKIDGVRKHLTARKNLLQSGYASAVMQHDNK